MGVGCLIAGEGGGRVAGAMVRKKGTVVEKWKPKLDGKVCKSGEEKEFEKGKQR